MVSLLKEELHTLIFFAYLCILTLVGLEETAPKREGGRERPVWVEKADWTQLPEDRG